MPTSQSFSLRIIGYRPKHGDERERERITFNFVVPLPDCIADAATICALPPDAPCYRGQALSSLELDDILTEQQELAQARGNVQLQNVATDEPISAPRSVIERWNARTHIGTQPPWLPLDPSLPAREGDATLGTAERLSFSTKGGRIRSMLQTFCEHRTSTKCLLGRHFLYGWDIVALQEALLKLAREEAGLGPAALERVSVAVEDERPWLALRVFSPLVHKMVRLRYVYA